MSARNATRPTSLSTTKRMRRASGNSAGVGARRVGSALVRDPARALTLQLLEWIAAAPRSYVEVLDVWRTSCPRLSIWEDACIDGLVDCQGGREGIVTVTAKGKALLGQR